METRMTIKFSDITGGGIPYGNTAGRPANPGVGKLYSNGELQRLELYTGPTYGWQNIIAETPGVVGYTGSVLETNSVNSLNITGTAFATGAVATLVGNDGTEYVATTTTVSNTQLIQAQFGPLSKDKEPYDIKVTNPSNLYGVYYDIVTVNDSPIWTTSSGSLGAFYEQTSISVSVAASDEENNSITYSLASGSTLPSGITLNSSTGVISGTLPDISSDTTYTFTLNASDGSNQPTSRTFSITSIVPQPFTTDYLVVAGGGGGGLGNGAYREGGGGGGAGGLLSGSTSITPSLSYTVTVGSGGLGRTGSIGYGTDGESSVFHNLTTVGGGGGGPHDNNGRPGGSGGGAGCQGSSGGAGTSGQGNSGGAGYIGSAAGAGGGGGKGSAGLNGTSAARGGAGGSGFTSTITGSSVVYAAGGGGGGHVGGGAPGGAGAGQGGGQQEGTTATAASSNTGSGGGGGTDTTNYGRNGGSGIVIVKYPNDKTINVSAGLAYSTSTAVAGYKVTSFTSGSGTISFS
jgi:hypothetical protein